MKSLSSVMTGEYTAVMTPTENETPRRTIRIADDLWNRATEVVAWHGKSNTVSDVIRIALERFVSQTAHPARTQPDTARERAWRAWDAEVGGGAFDEQGAFYTGWDTGYETARNGEPRTITSQVEFDALPVGTLLSVAYREQGELATTTVLRIEGGSGAAAGDASLRSGSFWSEVWGWAETITVLYMPTPTTE